MGKDGKSVCFFNEVIIITDKWIFIYNCIIVWLKKGIFYIHLIETRYIFGFTVFVGKKDCIIDKFEIKQRLCFEHTTPQSSD